MKIKLTTEMWEFAGLLWGNLHDKTPLSVSIGERIVPEQRTLESIVDPFVKLVGGERISDIVGNMNPQSSADYLFKNYGVIAELKSLQAG